MRSLHRAQEELRSVGVRACVGHGEDAGASVLQGEILVSELVAIDGFTASTVPTVKSPP